MNLKSIKPGAYYETKLGIAKCIRSGGTHPPSVRMDVLKPFPRGAVNMAPRDVLRELSHRELVAHGLAEPSPTP